MFSRGDFFFIEWDLVLLDLEQIARNVGVLLEVPAQVLRGLAQCHGDGLDLCLVVLVLVLVLVVVILVLLLVLVLVRVVVVVVVAASLVLSMT